MIECPECSAEVRVPDNAIDGEMISCGECGSAFEVDVSESGVLSLKPAENVVEDWGE